MGSNFVKLQIVGLNMSLDFPGSDISSWYVILYPVAPSLYVEIELSGCQNWCHNCSLMNSKTVTSYEIARIVLGISIWGTDFLTGWGFTVCVPLELHHLGVLCWYLQVDEVANYKRGKRATSFIVAFVSTLYANRAWSKSRSYSIVGLPRNSFPSIDSIIQLIHLTLLFIYYIW